MEEEVLFSEIQRFRQKWIWVLLIVVAIIGVAPLVASIVMQLSTKTTLGKKQSDIGESVTVTLIFMAILAIVYTLIGSSKLETYIKKEGITVRFYPIQTSFKLYKWEDITKCYVRQYSPIKEFGGWGVRGGMGKSNALNVSGNMGIQLELKDGNKLLIGTNKPEEAEAVLRSYEL